MYQSGQPYAQDDILIRQDGGRKIRYISASVLPLLDAQQVVEGLLVIMIETTRQMEIRRALRSGTGAAAGDCENAPEGMIFCDEQARLLMGNPAAKRLIGQLPPYGEPYESYEDLRFHDSQGHLLLPRELPLMRSALDGETLMNVELIFTAQDGSQRVHLVNTAPVKDEEGQILGAVGMFQDITSLKSAEQRLLESQERYELASRAINGLLYEWDRVSQRSTAQSARLVCWAYRLKRSQPIPTGGGNMSTRTILLRSPRRWTW